MKQIIIQLSVGLIGIVLVTSGCATARGKQWEYKVAEPTGNPNNSRQAIEPFLNDMAKDGWIFMEKDSTGWYYFKRPKQ